MDREDRSNNKRQKTIALNSTSIPILSARSVSPEEFYSNFVSKRLPAKFDSLILDDQWKGHLWTNSYLIEKCKETVRVEIRDDAGRRFGKGREKIMPFPDFIQHIEESSSSSSSSGEAQYYLTTQDLEYDEEGRPCLTSPPVKQLSGDFPLRPRLTGNLVLQNANLWLGSSATPTSSGLHHDFHDNLYLLLRGQKIFTLFPPESAPHMYTYGNISHQHCNGRINYEGEAATNADGSHSSAQMLSESSKRLQELGHELSLVVEKSSSGGKGAVSRSEEEIEAEIDREMELMLEAEMEDEDEDEDEDDGDNDEEDDADGEDNEDGLEALIPPGVAASIASIAPAEPRTATKSQPSNFSRIDLSQPREDILDQFPSFPIDSAIHVTVSAGEMLYLPAGWFHEVKSLGKGKQGHCAFNYWFHPPNGSSFENPYATNFWQSDWEARGL